jgi:hypothetical protein
MILGVRRSHINRIDWVWRLFSRSVRPQATDEIRTTFVANWYSYKRLAGVNQRWCVYIRLCVCVTNWFERSYLLRICSWRSFRWWRRWKSDQSVMGVIPEVIPVSTLDVTFGVQPTSLGRWWRLLRGYLFGCDRHSYHALIPVLREVSLLANRYTMPQLRTTRYRTFATIKMCFTI